MASTTFTYTILTGTISTAGSIKNWAQHSLVPAEQILEEAQRLIYRKLRVREMMTETPITIASGAWQADFPERFLDPIYMKLDEDYDELDYVQENLLGRSIDSDGSVIEGRPQRYTVFDGRFQFDVANDETTDLNGDLVFYQEPALLSALVETNFLTDKYPTMLRRACLAFAYEHRKRMSEFNTEVLLVEQAIAEANMESDMHRRGQIMR